TSVTFHPEFCASSRNSFPLCSLAMQTMWFFITNYDKLKFAVLLRIPFYFGVKEWHNLASKTTKSGVFGTVQEQKPLSSFRGLFMGNIDVLYLVSHLIIYMVVLVLAISVHEAGHAWVSYKNGDDTAYMLGRVTLNPVAHTDPIGTLLIPIISFIF